MNCAELVGRLGFRCKPLNNGAFRIWSPFTNGDDGQRDALYIEPSADGYRITDNAESLMHASSMRANLSSSRLSILRRANGSVRISEGGEIFASASIENLSTTLIEVLNTALAVGHCESMWQPKEASTSFQEAVGAVLQDAAGDRLRRNAVVSGASGHQIEIPFVIDGETKSTYIQPVAYGYDRVDWDSVYRGLGKMLDLKNAGADEQNRALILEDNAGDDEIGKAATLLSVSASVVYFSRIG